MKRILTLVLALVLLCSSCLALAACGTTTYTVGICQLVPHAALDAATKGFKDALEAELGKGNVTFLEQNAGGDDTVCSTIVTDFVSKNVNLIMANATAALAAAAATAAATSTTPPAAMPIMAPTGILSSVIPTTANVEKWSVWKVYVPFWAFTVVGHFSKPPASVI